MEELSDAGSIPAISTIALCRAKRDSGRYRARQWNPAEGQISRHLHQE